MLIIKALIVTLVLAVFLTVVIQLIGALFFKKPKSTAKGYDYSVTADDIKSLKQTEVWPTTKHVTTYWIDKNGRRRIDKVVSIPEKPPFLTKEMKG